eukprot:UN33829
MYVRPNLDYFDNEDYIFRMRVHTFGVVGYNPHVLRFFDRYAPEEHVRSGRASLHPGYATFHIKLGAEELNLKSGSQSYKFYPIEQPVFTCTELPKLCTGVSVIPTEFGIGGNLPPPIKATAEPPPPTDRRLLQ